MARHQAKHVLGPQFDSILQQYEVVLHEVCSTYSTNVHVDISLKLEKSATSLVSHVQLLVTFDQ